MALPPQAFSRLFTVAAAAAVAVSMVVPGDSVNARQDQGGPRGVFRGVTTASHFDVSRPLADLVVTAPPLGLDGEIREVPERPSGLEGPMGPQDTDPVVQSDIIGTGIPAASISFDGPPNFFNVTPPDPVGDVGPNHYVAMSNLAYQIFSKDGTSVFGPAANNTLWAGFGGDCENYNSGDPIVLHDQLADRWILSQFTAAGPTYFNCVAVSTSPDPTGTYYRYAFSTGANFPDYPKYGVWPDALYISTREFAGPSFVGIGAYAVNRAQLIAGVPTPQVVSFLITPASAGGAYNIGDGLLPTDLDGSTLPPAGRPNFFVGTMDNGGPYGAPQDALTLWKFTADFQTPANSTFVLASTIPIAAYDTVFPCAPGARDCIPQPAVTQKIDVLSYRQRALHRLAYRNFGTYESLVTNQSVEAAAGLAGIRWWEIRSPNNSPVVYQQGTYAPGVTDGVHRWMGSIAMDHDGNMALGYSASSATTTFPSVYYTGRLRNDPLGTMSQGEASIINGAGAQTGSARWGDYTSMNVDPSDDCTFWYVNQYLPETSPAGWYLRIGAFRFPNCATGAAPTTVDDAYSTAVNTPLATPAPGVLANDNSNGGGAMSAELVTSPVNGAVLLSMTGAFTYTPNAGFVGADSFTYRAVNTVGSGNAATVTVLVPQPTMVQPPSDLYASTVTGNIVTLRWNAPSVGPKPTNYILEAGALPGEVLASVPTGSDTPIYGFVAPTGSFYVRVHSVLGADRSAASTEALIHVNVPLPPAAPTNLVSQVDGSHLALAWWNSFSGGAPTSLLLDVTGSVSTTIPLPLSDNFRIAGVPPGTYTLRLRAVNAVGASDQSDPVTVTFPGVCSGPPLPPVGFLAFRLGATIVTMWDPNVSGPAPTSYVVGVTGASVGDFATAARAASAAAAPGTYDITVTATNSCGSSAPTSVRTVTIR